MPHKDHPNRSFADRITPSCARAGGREMHNALTEGNGIAKHTACRYGNVSPPQVSFLSALSIDRRVRRILFFFYPYAPDARSCTPRRCYNTFIKYLSFPKTLSTLSSVYSCLSRLSLHIGVLSYSHPPILTNKRNV